MSIASTQTMTPAAAPDVEQVPAVEFAHIDPTTLTIDVNVRTTASLGKDFVASIREHGVLTPILAVRQVDGALYVRAGQRRTLAAIEAGLASIPVRIIDATTDAERIVQQVIENDQRLALPDSDRIAAFEQLSLMGVSPTQIARRLHTKKATVEGALTVAKSPPAVAATREHDLTLDQGLVLTEFEDAPGLVEALTQVAVTNPGAFDHTAQRLRDERAEQAAIEALTASLTDAGVTVIDFPGWDSPVITRLSRLRDTEGARLTPEAHATCPGHGAYIANAYDGHRPEYVCMDPKANAHTKDDLYGNPRPVSGGAMSEQEKAERREVVANNKAWKSAETVRRTWLRDLAARKTAPKDAGMFLAHVLATRADDVAHAAAAGHTLACDLLGLSAPKATGYGYYGRGALSDLIAAATPARAQVIALTLALAGVEQRTGTHTWRNPSVDVARYLRTLAAWGYGLAEVEQTTLARHDATHTAPQDDQTDDGEQGDQDEQDAEVVDEEADDDEEETYDEEMAYDGAEAQAQNDALADA